MANDNLKALWDQAFEQGQLRQQQNGNQANAFYKRALDYDALNRAIGHIQKIHYRQVKRHDGLYVYYDELPVGKVKVPTPPKRPGTDVVVQQPCVCGCGEMIDVHEFKPVMIADSDK